MLQSTGSQRAGHALGTEEQEASQLTVFAVEAPEGERSWPCLD